MFIDNESLNDYVNLITASSENQLDENVFYQKHHIIPRSCYTHRNLEVDDSEDNLVTLKFSDHVLAHYYLSLCLITNQDRQANIFAFLQMSKKDAFPDDLKELIEDLPYIQELYDNFREYLNSPEIRNKMDTTHRETCNKNEWRSMMSNIVSDYTKNNPYTWINNGQINKRLYKNQEIPEGFIPGRLPPTQKVKDKIRQTTIENHKDQTYRENQAKKSKEAWEKGCYAKRKYTGHPSWNTGLTKESSQKLMEISQKRKGFKMSDEAKAKISKSHKGLKPSNCIKVMCIETGIIYLSINDATKITGISCYKLKKAIKDPNYLIDNKHWVIYQE